MNRQGQATSSANTDFYALLGVTPGANSEEIKRAYRALAMELHPDRNPGSDVAIERFKTISLAYAVLSDAERRASYDRSRRAGDPPELDLDPDLDLEEIVSRFSPGALWRRKHGEDLKYTLHVSFLEAITGKEMTIRVPRRVRCETCQGSGKFRNATCTGCRGETRSAQRTSLKVPVPAGVEDGQRLKVSGHGNDGEHGGRPGDLFVEVRVDPHPLLTRNGLQVECEVPITFWQAALGCEVTVPTLTGKARVTVPRGTQAGTRLRLHERGARQNGVTGDQIVTIQVIIPDELDRATREILDTLSRTRFGLDAPAIGAYEKKLRSCEDS